MPTGLDKKRFKRLTAGKPYKSKGADWFSESYNVFTAKNQPQKKEEFYELIAFAYSWMPTIPKVEPISDKSWAEIKVLIGKAEKSEQDLRALLKIMIHVVNNSIVGASKVLHFMYPKTCPIIDSRVLKTWNLLFRKEEGARLMATMLVCSDRDKQIEQYIHYRHLMLDWKQKLGDVSLRDLELALYSYKQRRSKKKK